MQGGLYGIYDGTNTQKGKMRALNGASGVLNGAFVRNYCQELRTWMAQLPDSDIPSRDWLQAVNNFIIGLKQEGIWQLLDRMWIMASEYQSNARISIVNPNGLAASWSGLSLTEVNNPTWTPRIGYTGNGTSSYLNCNYNSTTSQINFTNACGSLGTWRHTAQITVGNFYYDIGYNSSSYASELYNYGAQDGGYVSAATVSYSMTAPSVGFVTASKASNSVGTQAWYNGNLKTTTSVYTGGNTSEPIYIMATTNYQSEPNPVGFSPRTYSFAYIGSGLINQLALHTLVMNLAQSIGF